AALGWIAFSERIEAGKVSPPRAGGKGPGVAISPLRGLRLFAVEDRQHFGEIDGQRKEPIRQMALRHADFEALVGRQACVQSNPEAKTGPREKLVERLERTRRRRF